MDIVSFNLVRPVRKRGNDGVLRLVEVLKFPRKAVRGAGDEKDKSVRLTTLPALLGSAKDDPLALTGEVGGVSPLQRVYWVLNSLHQFLATENDRMEGKDLSKKVDELLDSFQVDAKEWALNMGIQQSPDVPFRIALLGLRQYLLETMMKAASLPDGQLTKRRPDKRLEKPSRPGQRLEAVPELFERAVKATRLAVISSVVDRSEADMKMLKADDIFDLLNRTTVILDGVGPNIVLPKARVKLIREAKVADLHVVRREWAGYVASEIANIRNVMAGEIFKQRDKTSRETETTTTSETERREQAEREDQSKLNSELAEEVATQLGITVNGHFDASYEYKTPVVTANISGGADIGLSMQRSERHATKIAREAITRSLNRIESRSREIRTRRELLRTKQGNEYALDNSKGDNNHGVYRWVDRVDTYQVFRYPDRFLLEFQIPEPAEFYRWRTDRQKQEKEAVDQPPEWDVTLDDIRFDNLVTLAAKYRASGLSAPPDEEISVAQTLSVEIGKESIPKDMNWVLNPPFASKEVEITIPPNYSATNVMFQGEGYPILAWWEQVDAGNKKGIRSAFASISVGQESKLYWNGGIVNKNKPNMVFKATHGNDNDPGTVGIFQEEDPPYGRALLPIGSTAAIDPDTEEVLLDPPAVNVLKVGVTTVGVLTCSVTFLVKCQRTGQAYSEWQLGVYDALYSAWAQWKKDYETARSRQAVFGSTAADSGSSQRNESIIREELKREVISWLLDESSFDGRPGLKERPKNNTDFADINFERARLDAPTIQFLEQAFEWSNLSYFFYPYYWASRSDWPDLSQIVANDPEFERFLRAGSARVIVPARPGFDVAVKNWLQYQIPFMDGHLPAPDEALYISVDKEIRELTSPWEGGIPGDTWQSRVSTTLLYLEEQGDLPFINDLHQLPAEQGKHYVPKPIIEFT
jgi:hypothetical protein